MAKLTSIRELRQKLGRTGLLDSTKVRIVRALRSEVPTIPGMTFFGWTSVRDDTLVKDERGRVIIKLTDDGLASLEKAVETVGHELHHIREFLAGAGHDEEAAKAAGRRYANTFKRRLAQLD